jgi:hypothetical protein
LQQGKDRDPDADLTRRATSSPWTARPKPSPHLTASTAELITAGCLTARQVAAEELDLIPDEEPYGPVDVSGQALAVR